MLDHRTVGIPNLSAFKWLKEDRNFFKMGEWYSERREWGFIN